MYVEVVEKVHIKISISKNLTLSKYQVLKFLVKTSIVPSNSSANERYVIQI